MFMVVTSDRLKEAHITSKTKQNDHRSCYANYKVTYYSRQSSCSAWIQTNKRGDTQLYPSVLCVRNSARGMNGVRGMMIESRSKATREDPTWVKFLNIEGTQ